MPLKSAKQWAEDCDAALAALVSGGLSSYTLAGRTFTRQNLKELRGLHAYWRGMAQEEDHGYSSAVDISG